MHNELNRVTTKPKYEDPKVDTRLLKRKTKDIMDKIDLFIDGKSNDIEEMKRMKDKLRGMRASALRKGGEFSIENLVFKELRNNGYLSKFSDYIKSKKVKELSL